MLTKWVGAESEIDFTKDEVLSHIRNIESHAFKGNNTLKSIVLPPSLVTIEVYAFQNCTSLEEVRFAEQEDSYYIEEQYLYLLDYCFEQCSNLRKVYLPGYLQQMEAGIFKDCPNLTSITISSKHPYLRVQDKALITNSLPRTLVLFPPGIEGNYTVHSQITNIGKGAFYSTKLTSVFLPKAVETIEEEAFCEATLLKTINFPIGLRTIKNSAFYRCSSLTTFIFPNSLETIEGLAFSRCKGLPTTVKLPGQIVSLEASAFSANPQVQAYSIDANNPNYIVEDGVLFNGDRSILISIPSGRKSYQLPEGITEIGGGLSDDLQLKKFIFRQI
ncbi:leucine-rich repeat domain-containing protein [Porphyromonas circumdentaria]|uniref:leucine-rich repeat domain-containing protein n=1 Tax=Porphyromonas circumdentaria TaxID=29524 RepID=UPI0026DD4D79|nr:leucine-rich repeat domain-containing protein [Porphyromonas circumdentaria]MDO4723082.1 leucine-rich repeat domain-containing protein [Porphyromonas circumdentaria]